MITTPKLSWFVPFGPVNNVDLVKVAALQRYRETSGAKYTQGKMLTRLEAMFSEVTEVEHDGREDTQCFLHGKPGSDDPGMLFVVRDGAIISIKPTDRSLWTPID